MKEKIWQCKKCGWVGSESLMTRTWVKKEDRKVVDLICPRNTKENLDCCGSSQFKGVKLP